MVLFLMYFLRCVSLSLSMCVCCCVLGNNSQYSSEKTDYIAFCSQCLLNAYYMDDLLALAAESQSMLLKFKTIWYKEFLTRKKNVSIVPSERLYSTMKFMNNSFSLVTHFLKCSHVKYQSVRVTLFLVIFSFIYASVCAPLQWYESAYRSS